jgi:hypothetical protein
MPRNVTPNGSGDLVFTERVVDGDGDALSVESLELHKIDGVTQTGSDRSPPWLSYTTATNTLSSGATELLVDVVADSTGVASRANYEFWLYVSDPSVTRRRSVDLTVRPGKNAASRIWIATSRNDGNQNLCVVRADGTIVNKQTVSAPDNGEDSGVAATDNGEGLFGADYRLARFDSSLNVVWEDTLAVGKVVAVAQGPKGFIYYIDESYDMYRLNRSGGEREYFHGALDGRPNTGLYVDDQGRVLYSDTSSFARLLDPSGSVIFRKDAEDAVAMAPDRDFVVISNSDNSGNYPLSGYDKSGNRRFNTNEINFQGLSVHPEKDIFAGANEDEVRLYDFSGKELARDGLRVWAGYEADCSWDEDDNLFVCVEGNNEDTYVFRYDEDLNEQWRTNYDGTGGSNIDELAIGVPRTMG